MLKYRRVKGKDKVIMLKNLPSIKREISPDFSRNTLKYIPTAKFHFACIHWIQFLTNSEILFIN